MEKFIVLPNGAIENKFCPFQTGAYAPGNMAGQVAYLRQQCSVHCAHFFSFVNDENQKCGVITCSGFENVVFVEEKSKLSVSNGKN